MIQHLQHNEKDGTQVFEHLKILHACLKFFVDGLLCECWAWIFANQQEPLAPKGLPARFLDSVMIQDTVVLRTWVQFVGVYFMRIQEIWVLISKYAALVWLFSRMAVTGFDYMHQGQWWSVRVSACVVLESRSPNKGLSAKDFNYLQKSEAAHAKAHFWSITCASCTSAFHDLWCTSKQILVLSTKYVLNVSKFAICSRSQCCAVNRITVWSVPSHKMTVCIYRLRSLPCTPKSRRASENLFEDIGRLSIKAFCYQINAKPSCYTRYAVTAGSCSSYVLQHFYPPKGIKEDLRSRSKAREAARA